MHLPFSPCGPAGPPGPVWPVGPSITSQRTWYQQGTSLSSCDWGALSKHARKYGKEPYWDGSLTLQLS